MQKVEIIIEWLKSEADFKTDTQLAEFLGVTQQTISSWRRRETIDYKLVIDKFPAADLNLLFRGEGSEADFAKLKAENQELRNQVELLKEIIIKSKSPE